MLDAAHKILKSMPRPLGSKNKNTTEQIDRVKRILSALDETLTDDLTKLSPAERVRLWASMQEFVMPKYARIIPPSPPTEPMDIKISFVGKRLKTSEDEPDTYEIEDFTGM